VVIDCHNSAGMVNSEPERESFITEGLASESCIHCHKMIYPVDVGRFMCLCVYDLELLYLRYWLQ